MEDLFHMWVLNTVFDGVQTPTPCINKSGESLGVGAYLSMGQFTQSNKVVLSKCMHS